MLVLKILIPFYCVGPVFSTVFCTVIAAAWNSTKPLPCSSGVVSPFLTFAQPSVTKGGGCRKNTALTQARGFSKRNFFWKEGKGGSLEQELEKYYIAY